MPPEPKEQAVPVVGETVAEQAIWHLSRLVRVYGDMQDGYGNTPTEIRHAERFLSEVSTAVPVVGVEEAVERIVRDAVLSASVEVPEKFSERTAMRETITKNTTASILQALQGSSACADTHRATEQPVVGVRNLISRDYSEELCERLRGIGERITGNTHLSGEIVSFGSVVERAARQIERFTAAGEAVNGEADLGGDEAEGAWIEHDGGECPLADGTVVDVRYGDGEEAFAQKLHAGHGTWAWDKPAQPHESDVIAYRVAAISDDEQPVVAFTGHKHDLKTWPEPFAAVRSGLKPWELRKNDRGYQVGDLLWLREWSEDTGYTGECCGRLVTWMLEGGQFGLPEGFVIMSLDEVSDSGEAALGGDGDAAWDRFSARFTLNCEAVIDDAGRVDFSDALIAAQDAVGRYGLTLLASAELRADLKQYTGRADDAGRLAREVISLLDQSVQNKHRKLGGDEAEGGVNKDLQAQLKAAYEALVWLGERRNLELSYGYEDEEQGGWQVHRVSGNRNDREWELLATAETPEEAIAEARQALARRGEGDG